MQLSAQLSRRADSLFNVLSHSQEDSVLMRLNLEIADEIIFSHPDTVGFFLKRGLAFAQKSDNRRLLARAHNLFGIYESTKGKNLSALEHYQQSQELFEELGDEVGYSNCINNIGTIYSEMGRDTMAIRQFKESYRMKVKLGDTKNAAFNLFNIASSFISLNQADSALRYVARLNELQENAAEVYIEPAPLLAEIFLKKEQYQDALQYYTIFHQYEVQHQDEHFQLNALLGMARSYVGLGKFQEASRILDEVLQRSLKFGFQENRLAVYEIYTEIFSEKGQYADAFSFQNKYLSLKDSLEKINDTSEMNELNARYETTKREKELIAKDLIISEQEASRKAFTLTVGIVFIAVLTITLLVVAFLIKNKRQNRLLNAKNKEITEQRHKIISSINYAQKIQSSILAPEEHIRRHFPDSFIYFKPKDIVSGDFYWFTEVGDKVMISTIDCTGHGVPGAFMSLIANSKLNTVVREKQILDPGSVLNEVHKEIVHALHQQKGTASAQDGMDMSLCLIDRNKRKIWYAGAQNSIILVNGDSLEEIKADNISIGGTAFEDRRRESGKSFITREIDYESGTYLFMFTDGYLDQFGGESSKKFNKGRFRKLILDITHKGITHAKSHIEEQFEAWRRQNPQIDDILIIGARL